MDSSDILSHLEQLDDEIDDLEDSLAPMLKNALSDTTSKLPLLDRTKAYVLLTYAIESVLFSYLRLNGVKAREHPVFKELTRVKQYFDKIKATENPVGKRDNLTVDKQAAGRFIKAGLSGNEKYDLERAEKQAKEKARAHIKFDELSKKRKAEEVSTAALATESDSESSAGESIEQASSAAAKSKKRKSDRLDVDGAVATRSLDAVTKDKTQKKKSAKKSKKGKKMASSS